MGELDVAANRTRLLGLFKQLTNGVPHFYEQSRLEVARCFYLLANGRCIVSEASTDADETGLAQGIAFASYEHLEDTCSWYLEHPAERAAVADAGRHILRKRSQAALLAPAITALAER